MKIKTRNGRLPEALPMQFRLIPVQKLDRGAGADPDKPEEQSDLYEVAVSSEYEVERWYGTEVLDHSKGSVRLERAAQGLAVLVDHGGDQVGVTERYELDPKGKRTTAALRFSRSVRGAEIKQDVDDKIRRWISLGYWVHEIAPAERDADGYVTSWRVVDWEPLEVSLVSVPADPTVGVGRNVADAETRAVKIRGITPTREETRMKLKKVFDQERNAVIEVPETDPRAAVTLPGDSGGGVVTVTDNRAQRLAELGSAYGAPEKVADWIKNGTSVEDAQRQLLDSRKSGGTPMPARETGIELTDKERGEYSLRRAILGAIEIREGRSQNFKGFERDLHDQIEKDLPQGMKRQGGVLVPMRTQRGYNQRALDSITAGKGVETVLPVGGDLIDLLRPSSAILGAGATVLTGLGAPVSMAKQTGGMTVYWVGENPAAAVTASDIALQLVNINPKTLQGQTSWSRQLLQIANQDVENLVRRDFAIGHALAVDKAGIHGKGAAGEPAGIYKAPDVNVIAMGGPPTFGKLVDMATEIAKDNALLGDPQWITSPGMAGKLMQTLVASAAGSAMIWSGNHKAGSVVGYGARSTNQCSSTMTGSEETGGSEHSLVIGNLADMIVAFFFATEILVDPYTLADKGMVKAVSFQMADIALRRGESFCKATGATLT